MQEGELAPSPESWNTVLFELYKLVERPGVRAVQDHADRAGAGGTLSKATVGNLLNATTNPRRSSVEAFVAGCLHYARSRKPPIDLPGERDTQNYWMRRYDRAAEGRVGARGARASAVRSAYHELVLCIAPPELLGRSAELAALAEFCTDPDGRSHLWWRSQAWAGKSALLSWFVLNPPPRIRVVSFFITARFAGQSDWLAFTDVVMEQIAEVLRQPLPAYLPYATRAAHLRRMLAEAALYCRERGERLVLVVDGLDEDRGVTADPDSYSIAGLLPAEPPHGMRVVVSGRLNPPLPRDVAADHPLHDVGSVRTLRPSEHARVARNDMERDLKRLLNGTLLEQSLLGLITSAGGGLTGADLSALTGEPVWRIKDHLHAMAGRSFVAQASGWRPGTESLAYVLGHEEIQESARQHLEDAGMARYRQRLLAWADRHRSEGWPTGTPEYLLRGYFSMLRETKDLRRLVACATDRRRHDRLADVTGGDTAALNEVNSAYEALLAHDPDNLTTLAGLALYRSGIERRNANVPVGLPSVRTVLGQSLRALASAQSIPDPERRMQALLGMAEPLTAAGNMEHVEALVDSVEDAESQLQLLFCVIACFGKMGQQAAVRSMLDRAASLITSFNDVERQLTSLVTLVEKATDAGEDGEALRWAEHAVRVCQGCLRQEAHRAAYARASAYAGDWHAAEAAARSIDDENEQGTVFVALVTAAVRQGDIPKAERLSHAVQVEPGRSAARSEVVRALIARGDLVRATRACQAIFRPERLADSLIGVAGAWQRAGHTDRALSAADEALAAARQCTDRAQVVGLNGVVPLYTETGAHEQARAVCDEARAVAESIRPDDNRHGAMSSIVAAGVLVEGEEAVESWCRTRAEPSERLVLMTALARELASAGEFTRAGKLADEIERDARAVSDPRSSALSLSRLSWWTSEAGDLHAACAVAEEAAAQAVRITDPIRRESALSGAIQCLARAGATRRAESLARSAPGGHTAVPLARGLIRGGEVERGESVVRMIDDPWKLADGLGRIASALADVGEYERAERMARSVGDRFLCATALVRTASALAFAGEEGRARSLIDEAEAAIRVMGHNLGMVEHFKILAGAAVRVGDRDRALAMADEALRIMPKIISADRRCAGWSWIAEIFGLAGDPSGVEQVGTMIAEDDHTEEVEDDELAGYLAIALARANKPDRAEGVARSIADRLQRAKALTKVAILFARAGYVNRAESLAASIEDRQQQSIALTALAEVTAPAVARRLLATALRSMPWDDGLHVLARLAPEAVHALAREVLRDHARDVQTPAADE
ncbi:tetratricopeptide repeat protein (plasmid) [Streptomyces sp. AHU1]|uniref:tetratricopeptide repeat protein n=1 Tax=Streptomyces sp. AHU1 TaxID=3377215 RepID=UPI003877CBB4